LERFDSTLSYVFMKRKLNKRTACDPKLQFSIIRHTSDHRQNLLKRPQSIMTSSKFHWGHGRQAVIKTRFYINMYSLLVKTSFSTLLKNLYITEAESASFTYLTALFVWRATLQITFIW
jgi:hypothetical protein